MSIRSFRVAALVATSLLSVAGPARACDLCAIYTGSLMQQERTGLLLAIGEQYTHFGSVRVDGGKVANLDDEWVHSSITQLVAGWSFTPQVGVQASLPLVGRDYRRTEDGVAARGDENGIGDLSLFLRAAPLSRNVGEALVHAELFAGLKLPTGDTDRLAEELDGHHDDGGEDGGGDHHDAIPAPHHEEHEHASAVHGHDLTLGTGSVDGVFGASLHASWKRLFADLSVQYVLRGNGDYDYEYDDDVTWEASPGVYVLVRHDWTGALRFVTTGENKDRDRQAGEIVEDTAITAVYLGPGARLTWGASLHADLAVDIPVVQDTSGRQIVADWRLRGGLAWRF